LGAASRIPHAVVCPQVPARPSLRCDPPPTRRACQHPIGSGTLPPPAAAQPYTQTDGPEHPALLLLYRYLAQQQARTGMETAVHHRSARSTRSARRPEGHPHPRPLSDSEQPRRRTRRCPTAAAPAVAARELFAPPLHATPIHTRLPHRHREG
jgi:hypothetical protein